MHEPSTSLSSGEAGLRVLLQGYRVPEHHFDELRDVGGMPRSQWRTFSAHAGELTSAQLTRAQARVARQIHENGVTYNVYAAADGPTRPWGLDVLPLVVPSREWETLASGLRQRARLLNALAADIYGPQRLLAEGCIPPALVFAHIGYLRSCHGVVPPNGCFLHQVAFDLARAPDGAWRVIGARTQAPAGAGYALENRVAIARLFPDAFRELRVHRLAPFFRTLQETLLGAAPTDGEVPHAVLLTPGPYNETYFEHSYLAQYLGFTLVEGSDLTVRDDRVYLKTVTGLHRVHAILRRLDDDFCDPLELRPDSTLGVPGLLQAWRAGRVLVANAFGAGVLESPALFGFLPAACERLCGEPLELPSIATWWCGERAALDRAMPRLSEMVIKPAFPDNPLEPVFVGGLGPSERHEWVERLHVSPEPYVLEEYLPLSHAPVWYEGVLESRALMLRVFLVSDGRGDYRVMSGGLARIAGADRQIVSGQRGGSSKDTWALSDGPVERLTLLPGKLGLDDITHGQRIVSSRAGENLFWLGRYAERSENGARLLRAALSRLPDIEAFPSSLVDPLVRTALKHGLLRPLASSRRPSPTVPPPDQHGGAVGYASPNPLAHALIDSLFDSKASHGVAFNVEQTVRAAGAVRDRLSSDNWRLLGKLVERVRDRPVNGNGLAETLELLDDLIISLVAVGGLEMAHMTRDDGWRFLSLGRHLERVLFVTTTIGEVLTSVDSEDPTLLEWLLDLSDSIITYRARYMRRPEWLAVMELLLFDPRNPRSAVFQLAKLAKHVRDLPDTEVANLADVIDRVCAKCRPGDTSQGELFERTATLEGVLRLCEQVALRLSDALTLQYFSHVYEPTHTTGAR
jgi:uncharacterized circularly permuted ATP-grasp superfamily protein/uncharacterized alpha-E superfamily protein